MTEYERRIELLNQTRNSSTVSFSNMEKKNIDRPKSTLGLRVTICIVCFICYVLFDYGNMKVMNVNSKAVMNQIKQDIHLTSIQF